MKKVLILDGSMRNKGNTSILVDNFLKGAKENTMQINHLLAKDLNINYCNGCLRCNLIKRCSIVDDDWPELNKEILQADVLVFASPVYFHYTTAALKKIIDRFRSFVHVQITETGLIHTPWNKWEKDFVLLLSMGSSDDSDAQPIIELFDYMKKVLGKDNKLHVIKATRLAVIKQIEKPVEDLIPLYKKLNIPEHVANVDFEKNQKILNDTFQLGKALTE